MPQAQAGRQMCRSSAARPRCAPGSPRSLTPVPPTSRPSSSPSTLRTRPRRARCSSTWPTDAVAVTFRRARRDEVPAIVAMLADDELGATREGGADPLPDAYWRAFDAIDADERQLLVVGEDDEGAVVATLQLSFIPSLTYTGGERAQVEAVRVAASTRGQGVGHQLME